MSEELEEYPREPLDTDTIFAKFTRVTLSDYEVCSLSLASMVSNSHVPAAGIYLTYVSHCDCFVSDIKEFCLGVARQLADGKYKARDGKYRRSYVEGYKESWGKTAVADAMTIAFLGKEHCPGEIERCVSLGVGRQAYRRIRDFLAGLLKIVIDDYRMALEWAMGKRRDTELQSRWGRVTGEKWSSSTLNDIMGRESNKGFSEGCFRAEPASESDSSWKNNRMMLHVGFNEDELWKPS